MEEPRETQCTGRPRDKKEQIRMPRRPRVALEGLVTVIHGSIIVRKAFLKLVSGSAREPKEKPD